MAMKIRNDDMEIITDGTGVCDNWEMAHIHPVRVLPCGDYEKITEEEADEPGSKAIYGVYLIDDDGLDDWVADAYNKATALRIAAMLREDAKLARNSGRLA